MKRFFLLKPTVIIVTLCILISGLCSCSSTAKNKYYSQKENYISVTGTVTGIKYNEDNTALYIDLSEMYPTLDDTCFKIVGKNLEIVRSNKIDDKLKIGEQLTFITAPRYFGDGYVIPIVAISINGESLLDFEVGYENLLDWLSK